MASFLMVFSKEAYSCSLSSTGGLMTYYSLIGNLIQLLLILRVFPNTVVVEGYYYYFIESGF